MRDYYEERRRKGRRSAFWRGFGFAALIAAVFAGAAFYDTVAEGGRRHVARFEVTGLITDNPDRDALLEKIAEDDAAEALVLRINSPGGTTAGSEALYASIRAVAAEKPVVAVLGEVAASGGYVAAIAADRIFARGNTLTGSIGVIMEYPDLTEVMARLGIGLETVRSSELKAEPSPFRPTSPAAREREQALVADGYAWFRELVGSRRGLDGAALDAVADGGVFSGRQAAANGLVDALGGEREALDWLESQRGGLRDLPVRTREVERDRPLVGRILGEIASTGGILEEISVRTAPKLYSIGP